MSDETLAGSGRVRVEPMKHPASCKDCKKVIRFHSDLVVINRPVEGHLYRMTIELCLTCWERLIAHGVMAVLR